MDDVAACSARSLFSGAVCAWRAKAQINEMVVRCIKDRTAAPGVLCADGAPVTLISAMCIDAADHLRKAWPMFCTTDCPSAYRHLFCSPLQVLRDQTASWRRWAE